MSDFAPVESTPAAPASQESPASQPASSAAPAAVSASPSPVAPTSQGGAIPDGYVPRSRINETRDSVTRQLQGQFQQQYGALESRYAQMERQLRALVGVAEPTNPEVDTIKNQFAQLFPKLAKLEERGEDVFGLLERSNDLQASNEHYWQSYGRQATDRLFDLADKDLGSPLNDGGKRLLHNAFASYVGSSPELTSRYASDPSIVNEFWNEFRSSVIDPARRGATSAAVGRAGTIGTLPQNITTGAVQPSPLPKMQNLDERTDAAWALFNSMKK